MTNDDMQRLEKIIQKMKFDILVHDSSHIVSQLNRATSRKYHAHDGDIRLTMAIHNYCYVHFHDYHERQSLDDITKIEHHLRSNKLFATWFDTFDMKFLITNANLQKQLQMKNCVKLKGTLFEAFISLLAKDQSRDSGYCQKLVEVWIKNILDEHFDFEDYFRYKNHTYMGTLNLPYKSGHDYKKEFKRLTNKLLRTIPFHSFPIVYNANEETYTLTINANPLLDDMPPAYQFSCTCPKKDECLQRAIYHFLQERAMLDQARMQHEKPARPFETLGIGKRELQ